MASSLRQRLYVSAVAAVRFDSPVIGGSALRLVTQAYSLKVQKYSLIPYVRCLWRADVLSVCRVR